MASQALLWTLIATRSAHVRAFGRVYPHHLGKGEALRRLKTGLAEVGTTFGHLFSVKEQTWTGDHLRFEVSALGQVATGLIDVAEDHVRLEMFLPWLLATLVGTIQPLIRKEGTLLS
jgi:Putative polyhydroxyalkanoic acid system protein (PHA_gran_rgn)